MGTNMLGLIESKENYKKKNFCKTRKSLSILMPFSTFSQTLSLDQEVFRPRGTLEWKVICSVVNFSSHSFKLCL